MANAPLGVYVSTWPDRRQDQSRLAATLGVLPREGDSKFVAQEITGFGFTRLSLVEVERAGGVYGGGTGSYGPSFIRLAVGWPFRALVTCGHLQWEVHDEMMIGEDVALKDLYDFDSPLHLMVDEPATGASLPVPYSKNSLIRWPPILALRDIDESMFLPMVNHSLATRIARIQVIAGGYELLEIGRDEFSIDTEPFAPGIPVEFAQNELRDPWVRIRPSGSSAFGIDFFSHTPKRLLAPRRPKDEANESEGGTTR